MKQLTNYFILGKKSFLCKYLLLFDSSNMAAMKTLYITPTLATTSPFMFRLRYLFIALSSPWSETESDPGKEVKNLSYLIVTYFRGT